MLTCVVPASYLLHPVPAAGGGAPRGGNHPAAHEAGALGPGGEAAGDIEAAVPDGRAVRPPARAPSELAACGLQIASSARAAGLFLAMKAGA